MSELRVRKMQEFIKQEVGNMLLRELKDPRLGFVTVTGVKLTGDLREATVYVSLFGQEEERKESLMVLNKSKGFIRKELGTRLKCIILLKFLLKKISLLIMECILKDF